MLNSIKGVGEKTIEIFNKLGINSISDLLNTLPKSYIDLSSAIPLSEAIDGDFCLVDLIITEKKHIIKKGRLSIFKARAKSGSFDVELTWFNSNFVSKILEENQIYTIYGKLKINNFQYEFINPKYEKKCDVSDFCGIHCIYRTKGLINQKNYSKIISECLKTPQPGSIINEKIEKDNNLMSLFQAYKNVHQPETMEMKKAVFRIKIESLVRRIAAFQLAKNEFLKYEKHKLKIKFNLENYKAFLPFQLNFSQLSALNQISNILMRNKALNGILCGDVGSGKSIISFLLCLFVVDNGYQAAIMAPNELLARQHYLSLKELLKNNDKYHIELLTSSVKSKEKNQILEKIKNNEINILVGTQSLLNKNLIFDKLAFVVEDEQHKFGVAQRTLLIDKGKNINVLTLSATPIPRSMQLIAYGDIESFYIENRFESKIKTAIVQKNKRNSMWQYLYDECIKKCGQAYIVAPKIEDIEGVEGESVNELYKELKNFFPEEKLGLLHGKLNTSQKNKILDNFALNKISILISTTVIEVVINVPNANFMVIMQAENFGLATLHQLRGRVGRGGQKGYCFLYTEKTVSKGLNILTISNNGLEIAEKDFDMRGSGEIFGLEQAGSSSLNGITIKELKLARKIVQNLNLETLKPQLKKEITEFALNNVSLT